MKHLLSIFDYTGTWAAPYDAAGHNVTTMDLKTGQDAQDFSCEWFLEEAEIDDVDGILLAPPCTDFTAAGAQYWPKKDADGTTSVAINIALQGLRAVEFWKPDFWALENPCGRINKLIPTLGKARLIFDPCDYAGYVTTPAEEAELATLRARNGLGEWTEAEVDLVRRTNAYTKRTALWGDFDLPEKRRIEPVKVCKAGSWLMRMGGDRVKTKAERSETPAGFAQAFAAANGWHNPQADARKRVVRYVRDLEDGAPLSDDTAVRLALEEFGEIDRELFLAAYRSAR